MLASSRRISASGATFGGCIAAGLSGPRRPYAGAVRDFVLGVRMLDGKGTDLRFGGQVMKNVAGYDVSRLMCRLARHARRAPGGVAQGAAPAARGDRRCSLDMPQAEAIRMMNTWAGRPLPITATCHLAGPSFRAALGRRVPAVRAARDEARRRSGRGRRERSGTSLREHTLALFRHERQPAVARFAANRPRRRSTLPGDAAHRMERRAALDRRRCSIPRRVRERGCSRGRTRDAVSRRTTRPQGVPSAPAGHAQACTSGLKPLSTRTAS